MGKRITNYPGHLSYFGTAYIMFLPWRAAEVEGVLNDPKYTVVVEI